MIFLHDLVPLPSCIYLPSELQFALSLLALGLVQVLGAVAEMMRGNNTSQEEFARFTAPPSGTVSPSSLVVLILITFDNARSLAERCAALYCFQVDVWRNG